MNLGELIRRNKDDRSYDQLAHDCGGAPTSQRIQQLATAKRIANFPDPSSLRGLARGLHVTEPAVVLAAAESVGLDAASALPSLVQVLPAGSEKLSDQEIVAVVAVIRAFVAAKRNEQQADLEEVPARTKEDWARIFKGVLQRVDRAKAEAAMREALRDNQGATYRSGRSRSGDRRANGGS